MSWKLISALAWRNLWRNHRRTLIMLVAIVVGVWAMIFMTALMRGMINNAVENGLESFIGHVQIHHKDYLWDPSISNSMPPPDKSLSMQLDNQESWAMRVRVPAAISSERETRGITLMGIQPIKEAQVSFVEKGIVEGRYLTSEKDKGVIIGVKLAEKLDTRLGKRIVLMSQDPNNNIVERGAKIVGIYKASLSSLEEQFVFTGIENSQNFLLLENKIHEIEILTEDFRQPDGVRQILKKQISDTQEIKTWDEIQAYLSSVLKVMDGFALIWMLVVFIALSFGLVNTLVMAVFERTREFGLMLALGMKPFLIVLQVICESLFLLILGLFIGTFLAVITIYPLQSGIDISNVAQGMEMMGVGAVLYPALYLKDIIMANVIVIILGILASLLPAIKASHLNPIKSLNTV